MSAPQEDNIGRNRIRTVTTHAYEGSTIPPQSDTTKIWVPTTDEENGMDSRDLVEFTIALSSGLHRSGLSSKNVEDSVRMVSEIFDVKVNVFAVPTTTIYSFGDEDSVLSKETHLLQTKNAYFDFTKVIAIKNVADAVFNGSMAIKDGTENIATILKEPARYDGLWEILGFMLVASGIGFLYRLGWPDMVAAIVLGFSAGVLSQWKALGSAFFIIAGFILVMMAIMIHNLIHPINIFRVAVAGIVQSIPGMILTQSFIEISSGHLVSGSSRALFAMLKLLSIAYGIIMGAAVWSSLYTVEIHDNMPVHIGFFPLFVILAGIGISIDLQVPVIHWWIAILTVTIAAVVGEWIAPLTNDLIAPLIGGLLVTMTSNLYSKVFPPHVAIMPTIAGMIILVPGGYGLRGMFALAIDGDTTAGVGVVFTMLLIATELAISVILGNIILPPQGHSGGGLSGFVDKMTSETMRKRWNRFRGLDESVGVTVSKMDNDNEYDEEDSDETLKSQFFMSQPGNL